MADYSDKSAAVSVTLNGATAATVMVGGVPEDTVKNIENLFGGENGDTFVGDGSANVLYGNGGNDRLSGGGSDDILYGGYGASSSPDGKDTLDGGAGVDTAGYNGKAASVVVTLNGA